MISDYCPARAKELTNVKDYTISALRGIGNSLYNIKQLTHREYPMPEKYFVGLFECGEATNKNPIPEAID